MLYITAFIVDDSGQTRVLENSLTRPQNPITEENAAEYVARMATRLMSDYGIDAANYDVQTDALLTEVQRDTNGHIIEARKCIYFWPRTAQPPPRIE